MPDTVPNGAAVLIGSGEEPLLDSDHNTQAEYGANELSDNEEPRASHPHLSARNQRVRFQHLSQARA